MATIMRVIPNRLYNELFSRGLIEGEKFFPSDLKKTPVSKVVNCIQPTLRQRGEKVLNLLQLKETAKKGEVSIHNQTFSCSQLAHLLERFILEDSTLSNEEDGKRFLKIVHAVQNPSEILKGERKTTGKKWKDFDEVASLVVSKSK